MTLFGTVSELINTKKRARVTLRTGETEIMDFAQGITGDITNEDSAVITFAKQDKLVRIVGREIQRIEIL